jgi:hypothetical protein
VKSVDRQAGQILHVRVIWGIPRMAMRNAVVQISFSPQVHEHPRMLSMIP